MSAQIRTHRGDLLTILGLVEQELVIRIHGPRSDRSPGVSSPWLECDHCLEVDETCRELAERLGHPTVKASYCRGLPKLDQFKSDLVLQRVRDSLRWLRQSTHWLPTAERTRAEHFRDLLVESWHSYAEPYWLERLRAMSSTPAVAPPRNNPPGIRSEPAHQGD